MESGINSNLLCPAQQLEFTTRQNLVLKRLLCYKALLREGGTSWHVSVGRWIFYLRSDDLGCGITASALAGACGQLIPAPRLPWKQLAPALLAMAQGVWSWAQDGSG